MKILKVTKRFKKDVKKLKNQGKNLDKLKNALDCICRGMKAVTIRGVEKNIHPTLFLYSC